MSRLRRLDRDLAACALLAAIALLPFLPTWLRGLTPYWVDLTYIHHPWRSLDAQLLMGGRLPLWNPYVYFGMPLAAAMQDSLFYPGTLPYFFFDFATATAIFHGLQYSLTGILFYAWLRFLNLSRAAALGGAISACLGGIFASNKPFLNHLGVLSLLPGLLLFLRNPPLLALTLACAFLAGFPPFWLGGAVLAGAMGGVLARRPGKLTIQGWFLAGALALGLSACLLLPATELTFLSRRASGVPLEESLRFGFSPRDLARWISPLLVGWGDFDPQLQWWTCCYLGVTASLAAAWGFLGLPRRRKAGLALLLAAVFLLILGQTNPLSAWLWHHLWPLRFLRYPGNLAYLALPALTLLAAAGFERLPRRLRLAAAALAAAELLAYAWARPGPLAPRELFASAGALVRQLQGSLNGTRYLLSPRALETSAGAGVYDWKHRLYGMTNSPFRISAAGNFGEPLVPRRSYEVMDALYRAPSAAAAAALFPWAGISVLMTPELLAPTRLLRHEGRSLWEIYRFPGDISLAYAFSREDGERIPAGLDPLPPVRGVPLAWRRHREDILEVFGNGPAEGWAYLAEPRYPGWRLRLASREGVAEAESLPAMGAFQKVRVPAGPWTLTLRYAPPAWRWGVVLSLGVLLGLAVHAAWSLRASISLGPLPGETCPKGLSGLSFKMVQCGHARHFPRRAGPAGRGRALGWPPGRAGLGPGLAPGDRPAPRRGGLDL